MVGEDGGFEVEIGRVKSSGIVVSPACSLEERRDVARRLPLRVERKMIGDEWPKLYGNGNLSLGESMPNGSINDAIHDPDEVLLWSVTPVQGLCFVTSDYARTACGLLVIYFALPWAIAVYRTGIGLLMGILILSHALWLVIGCKLIEMRVRSRTRYAVTDRRVIIRSEGKGIQVKSLDLRSLKYVRSLKRWSGPGDVEFGCELGGEGFNPWRPRMYQGSLFNPLNPPRIQMIENAEEVQQIIKEAKENALREK